MLSKIWISLWMLLLSAYAIGQDLNATVKVNSDQVQLSDKTVFKDMENAIFNFLNNRKWTTDNIATDEKINCTFILIINRYESPDVFSGSLQIQSGRPVYGTGYQTTLLNIIDEDILFKFSPFQTVEYQENNFVNNFSAIFAFYALMVAGMDYASFGPDGGNPYFVRAQQLVNAAQSATEPGWKAFDSKSNRNRYWLIENMLNPRYKAYQEAWLNYHRKGLDAMGKNKEEARKEITNSLLKLQQIFKLSPSLYIMHTFFLAKADEIVNIYKDALPAEKTKMIELLNEISQNNSNRWNSINQR